MKITNAIVWDHRGRVPKGGVGQLEVRITNYGARVLSMVYLGVDLLYGPKTPEELVADTCYCGAICGRVANRIAGGAFDNN